ncbi:MAG: hypothetical protein Q8P67_09535 [archaeon]|nr:hypothetical protein [archaeon]
MDGTTSNHAGGHGRSPALQKERKNRRAKNQVNFFLADFYGVNSEINKKYAGNTADFFWGAFFLKTERPAFNDGRNSVLCDQL